MASTPTTVFAWNKPAQGDADWDTVLSNNWDLLDADFAGEHAHESGAATHGNTKKNRCQIVADAAARAAIASPREGDMVWQSDTDVFYVYDGAAWDAVLMVARCTTGHIWIPTRDWHPSTSNGCAEAAKTEYVTNDVDLYQMAFDATADEHAQATLAMPADWGGGTITAVPYWTTATGDGGAAETVCWALQGRSYGNDEAVDQAWGTAQTSTDTWIADLDVHVGPATAAITLAGTPAAGELVQLRVFRDVSGDDLAADAQFIGAMVFYTRSLA